MQKTLTSHKFFNKFIFSFHQCFLHYKMYTLTVCLGHWRSFKINNKNNVIMCNCNKWLSSGNFQSNMKCGTVSLQ